MNIEQQKQKFNEIFKNIKDLSTCIQVNLYKIDEKLNTILLKDQKKDVQVLIECRNVLIFTADLCINDLSKLFDEVRELTSNKEVYLLEANTIEIIAKNTKLGEIVMKKIASSMVSLISKIKEIESFYQDYFIESVSKKDPKLANFLEKLINKNKEEA